MTQKNTAQATNQTAKAKAGAGTGKSTGSSASAGVDANLSTATVTDMDMDLEIDNQNSAMSKQPSTEQADTILEPAKRPNPAAVVHAGNAVTTNTVATLSPEIIELVAELRDTVRRINPSRHTPKTLRRSLSNVRDILDDINALDAEH
jgi:clumping factor A